MILGTLEKQKGAYPNVDWFEKAFSQSASIADKDEIYTSAQVAFSSQVPFNTPGYSTVRPMESRDGSLTLVFTGKIYNIAEIRSYVRHYIDSAADDNPGHTLLELYKQFGSDFVRKLNGKFAFAIWDKAKQRLVLYRDHLGIEPLYYYADDERFIFASSIPLIFKHPETKKQLGYKGIGKFLLFNYNPGLETFYKNIYKLRPAHFLVVDRQTTRIYRYWKPSFNNTLNVSEQEVAETLLTHLRDAVTIRMAGEPAPGVFLSGGMDSSTVLALAAEKTDLSLNTFSYRCLGGSFDESHYAKIMADTAGTVHHEIEYSGREVSLMPEVVKAMNEPFCDVGINIATYILGKEASRTVSYVLTGDGGDELFGGHPVYEADKVAQYVNGIPSVLLRPLVTLLSLIPDSDKKKSLPVKAKRFSESLRLPKELLTHRWRVYYHPKELDQLLTPSLARELKNQDLFEDVLEFSQEADSTDLLSRALYGDYQTVVDFYLRRTDLNRAFQLETRFPMFDRRLVEYCASIPSGMKVKGWFDTKHIFKIAMKTMLPHRIVHRKDKLGHSVPFKNWIRESDYVREFVLDCISESAVRQRDFFNYPFIQKLIEDHLSRRQNNSHRLWALAVLEMWLKEHLDST